MGLFGVSKNIELDWEVDSSPTLGGNMEHNCEQLECAFNKWRTCGLSFEGDEKKAWENYGTEKCKKQVDWSMKHQSVVD